MIRYAVPVLALIGVFFFPWGYTLFLALIASYLFPVVAVLIGILYDVLYYSPNAYPVPATVFGAVISVSMLFVRRFVSTYITDFS